MTLLILMTRLTVSLYKSFLKAIDRGNDIKYDTISKKVQDSCCDAAQKMKFSIKDFFSKRGQIRATLVTFTEEIIDENSIFCAA